MPARYREGKEIMKSTTKKMTKNIRLSTEGVWTHEGVEITHQRTVKLFFKNIYQEKDGLFYLSGERLPVPVEVEDVGFFVTDISSNKNGFKITLSDGSTEILDIASLDVGKHNKLYCKIKEGKAWARFYRKVYYELMKSLDKREGYYGLVIGDLFYPVQSIEEEKRYEEAAKQKRKEENKAKLKIVKTPASKPAKAKKKPVKKKVSKKKALRLRSGQVTKKKVAKKAVKKKAKTKKKTTKPKARKSKKR